MGGVVLENAPEVGRGRCGTGERAATGAGMRDLMSQSVGDALTMLDTIYTLRSPLSKRTARPFVQTTVASSPFGLGGRASWWALKMWAYVEFLKKKDRFTSIGNGKGGSGIDIRVTKMFLDMHIDLRLTWQTRSPVTIPQKYTPTARIRHHDPPLNCGVDDGPSLPEADETERAERQSRVIRYELPIVRELCIALTGQRHVIACLRAQLDNASSSTKVLCKSSCRIVSKPYPRVDVSTKYNTTILGRPSLLRES